MKKIHSKFFKISSKPFTLGILKDLEAIYQIKEIYRHHELHPNFSLLARCLDAVGATNPDHRFSPTQANATTLCTQLNKCISLVWTESRTKEFRNFKKNFFRASKENKKEILNYIRAHSECTGRILLLRMDVGWKTNANIHKLNLTEQLAMMTKNRELLFKFIKKSYATKFLGFVWKSEYGLRKGFHFHLILILNGRELRSDIKIVSHIGAQWSGPVTDHEGSYHNCNAFKDTYKALGIGPYSKNINPDMWQGIEAMCDYVTKPDNLVRLWNPENKRTMGKGNMPKRKA